MTTERQVELLLEYLEVLRAVAHVAEVPEEQFASIREKLNELLLCSW